MKLFKSWAAAAAMVALAGTAQANLVSLGDGTVKDTTTNLIWLQDWNVNGAQNWATQNAWAETGLDGFAGSNDWHLPSLQQYSVLLAEYGDLTSSTLPFTNLRHVLYWSGTENTPSFFAWNFDPVLGAGAGGYEDLIQFAVAVRPGDVAAVPEPQTLALALIALGAAMVARRRRPR